MQKDKNDRTPLDVAVSNKCRKIVEVYLKYIKEKVQIKSGDAEINNIIRRHNTKCIQYNVKKASANKIQELTEEEDKERAAHYGGSESGYSNPKEAKNTQGWGNHKSKESGVTGRNWGSKINSTGIASKSWGTKENSASSKLIPPRPIVKPDERKPSENQVLN